MAINYSKLGYDYTLALCAAIEAYTEQECSHMPKAFHYRGLNLRFAVERYLYIQCINSAPLFALYQSYKAGQEPDEEHFLKLSTSEAAIAHYLLQHSSPKLEWALSSKKSSALFYLRWLRKFTRQSLLYLKMHGKGAQPPHEAGTAPHEDRKAPPVLFNIGHPKFVNYLSPILQLFQKHEYAFLVTIDKDLAADYSNLDAPHIVAPAHKTTPHSLFLNAPLKSFTHLADAADATLNALAHFKPKCVVVIEGMSPLDIITAQACKQSDIPCICIQQGWSPAIHTGFRNMSFDEMYVWGQGFADLLAPYNPEQKFTITGGHAVQRQLPGGKADPRHSSAPETDTSPQKAISFFLQAPCALLDKQGYDDFIDLLIWAAKTYPDQKFIVRAHPGFPVPQSAEAHIRACANIDVSSAATESIALVLQRSYLAVSVFSTLLLEALPFGVVPLICSIGSMGKFYPDIAAQGAAIEITTLEDAKHELSQIIQNPSYLTPYFKSLPNEAEKYFSNTDAAQFIHDKIQHYL